VAIETYLTNRFNFTLGTNADLGACIGILTKVFLDAGYTEYSVYWQKAEEISSEMSDLTGRKPEKSSNC
jgi:hypothetical protein